MTEHHRGSYKKNHIGLQHLQKLSSAAVQCTRVKQAALKL